MTASSTGPIVRKQYTKARNVKQNSNSYTPSSYSSYPALFSHGIPPPATTYSLKQLQQLLLPALLNLDGVEQSPWYHPEGDALYHSLQVFQLACKDTDDPELVAAALFHDLGKSIDGPNHDVVGAQMLDGLLSPRIVWLVEHHLDLLKKPKQTRSRLRGTVQLVDLEKLRRWDLDGRRTDVEVIDPKSAVEIVLSGLACAKK